MYESQNFHVIGTDSKLQVQCYRIHNNKFIILSQKSIKCMEKLRKKIFHDKIRIEFYLILESGRVRGWGAIAQWLRCCATNRKVAGSILAGVIDIKSFRSRYGSGVDLAFNRNEYQEYFLGVKAVGA